MTKFNLFISILSLGLLFSLGSCSSKSSSVTETIEDEVLADDSVELREDQIKLAGIQTGAVEMRSLGNILKVNGIVSAPPQNKASVCMPLGGQPRVCRFIYAASMWMCLVYLYALAPALPFLA